LQVTFPSRNVGNEDLSIRAVRADCGCVAIDGTEDWLHPGEEGAISLRVALTERRGPFAKHVFVQSNDSVNPSLRLRIQGLVMCQKAIVEDKLAFGTITPGTKADRYLLVRDPGDGSLRILGCEAKIDSVAGQGCGGEVTISASGRPWRSDGVFENSPAGRKSRGRPGDYVVNASILIESSRRAGQIEGELKIAVHADGVRREVILPVSGCVEGTVTARPAALLINVAGEENKDVTREIVIVSADPITIKEVVVEDVPVTVSFQSNPIPTLRVVCTPELVGARNVEGELTCRTTDGREVVIPCQIIQVDPATSEPVK